MLCCYRLDKGVHNRTSAEQTEQFEVDSERLLWTKFGLRQKGDVMGYMLGCAGHFQTHHGCCSLCAWMHSHTQPANTFVHIYFRVIEDTISGCECICAFSVCAAVHAKWACALPWMLFLPSVAVGLLISQLLPAKSVAMVLWYWSLLRWLIPQRARRQARPSGQLSTRTLSPQEEEDRGESDESNRRVSDREQAKEKKTIKGM